MLGKQVEARAKKDGVSVVHLQFVDIHGSSKEVLIRREDVANAVDSGVWFDSSSTAGYYSIERSDLFLKPDPSTYAVIPWGEEGHRSARMICDVYTPEGRPSPADPRGVLRRMMERVREMGYMYNVGAVEEFYLFHENGTGLTDSLTYFDPSPGPGDAVLKSSVKFLEAFGIRADAFHHEVGPGQYEIDIAYGNALRIADSLLTLKLVVKKVAASRGMNATFMPKPVFGQPGSGMHVHQSLANTKGKNKFHDKKDSYGLSRIAYNFIAGQMLAIHALCAVTNPLVNSYKRLVPGYEAPVYTTWASMNRSALIRVPARFKSTSKSARAELRNPDPSCNPYLAFAAMLGAGLHGIEKDELPPRAVEENVYKMSDSRRRSLGVKTLPDTLEAALNAFRKSKVMKDALGTHIFEKFLEIKAKEWKEYSMQVTPWEVDRYLTY